MCQGHPLLPMGMADIPGQKPVKLYCARCEDIYNPKSSRHAALDGAFFGASFHNIFFQVYPPLVPPKGTERYVPRVYGFRVHAAATLIRWQDDQRDELRRRLKRAGIEPGYDDEEEDELDDEEDEEEEEEEVLMEAQGQIPVPTHP